MASLLQYSAVAALISSVSGFAVAAPPIQTLSLDGDNFSPVPTAAPNLDLVKAKLAKKALTNTCTEWTVPGGFGQPYCAEGGTCVFYSDINGNYERCGTVGVDYIGITECWNYGVQTGLAPVSQIYCPASAPYCGYIAFVFGPDATFTNFGCSTDAYSFFADYIATTTDEGGTTITTQPSLTVAGAGASSTDTSTTVNVNSVVTVTSTKNQGVETSSSTSPASAQTSSGGSSSSSSNSGTNPVKKNTPTGAIAGGVVGGLAVIAIAGFLIFWFCVRKRPEKTAAAQADAAQNAQTQQATSSAYKPPNGVSEISGTAKPAAVASVTPLPVAYGEKPANGNTNQSAYTETTQNAPSPPPMYGNFQQQQAPPPQQAPPQHQAPPQEQQYPPQQYPPQQQAPPQEQQQYPPQQYPPQQQAPPQEQQYPQQQYPPQQYPPQQYAAEQHPQQYPIQQHSQQYPPQQHPQQYPVPVPTSSPQTLAPSPGQQYREVAPGVDPRLSHPPVSPVGTSTYTQSPPMGTSELAGAGAGYQGHPSPPQQNVNELGGEQSVNYQVTHHVQEMSGSNTGGIAGPPQPPQQGGGYDMSGNPTSGEWRGHELA